jgi:hypothetical protein
MIAQRRKLTVLFSCDQCGLVDEKVLVPERLEREDVVHWVREVVGKAVREAHLKKSLLCEAVGFQNLKIPVDRTDPDAWVGKYIETVPPSGDKKDE